LKEKIESLSNDKEDLWKEIELLKNQLSKKDLLID